MGWWGGGGVGGGVGTGIGVGTKICRGGVDVRMVVRVRMLAIRSTRVTRRLKSERSHKDS